MRSVGSIPYLECKHCKSLSNFAEEIAAVKPLLTLSEPTLLFQILAWSLCEVAEMSILDDMLAAWISYVLNLTIGCCYFCVLTILLRCSRFSVRSTPVYVLNINIHNLRRLHKNCFSRKLTKRYGRSEIWTVWLDCWRGNWRKSFLDKITKWLENWKHDVNWTHYSYCQLGSSLKSKPIASRAVHPIQAAICKCTTCKMNQTWLILLYGAINEDEPFKPAKVCERNWGVGMQVVRLVGMDKNLDMTKVVLLYISYEWENLPP